MNQFVLHGTVFICFYCISLAFHKVEEIASKRKQDANRKHAISSFIASMATHPASIHAMQEFAAHVFVYSGFVIPSH